MLAEAPQPNGTLRLHLRLSILPFFLGAPPLCGLQIPYTPLKCHLVGRIYQYIEILIQI